MKKSTSIFNCVRTNFFVYVLIYYSLKKRKLKLEGKFEGKFERKKSFFPKGNLNSVCKY